MYLIILSKSTTFSKSDGHKNKYNLKNNLDSIKKFGSAQRDKILAKNALKSKLF